MLLVRLAPEVGAQQPSGDPRTRSALALPPPQIALWEAVVVARSPHGRSGARTESRRFGLGSLAVAVPLRGGGPEHHLALGVRADAAFSRPALGQRPAGLAWLPGACVRPAVVVAAARADAGVGPWLFLVGRRPARSRRTALSRGGILPV